MKQRKIWLIDCSVLSIHQLDEFHAALFRTNAFRLIGIRYCLDAMLLLSISVNSRVFVMKKRFRKSLIVWALHRVIMILWAVQMKASGECLS